MRQEVKIRLNKSVRAHLSESILSVIIGSRDIPGNLASVFIGTFFAVLLAFFSSLFNVLGNGYSFAYLLILSYAFGFGLVYILRTVVDKCIEETAKELEIQIASKQSQQIELSNTKKTIGANVIARIKLGESTSETAHTVNTGSNETSNQEEETTSTIRESTKKKDDDVNYPSDPRNPSHGSSVGTSSLFNSASMF